MKRTHLRWRLVLVVILGVVGCGQDPTHISSIDATRLYWALTLNHHAVTLAMAAPYDTVQLEATPRNALGGALSSTFVAAYSRIENDTGIIVTPDGMVFAHAPTAGIRVKAIVTIDGITHADTVWINVNDVPVIPAPPIPDKIALHVEPGPVTSLDCSMNVTSILQNGITALVAQAVNMLQEPIANTRVALSSSDSMTASVISQTGELNMSCLHTGTVWLKGSATVYGRIVEDSIRLAVTPPSVIDVNILSRKHVGEETHTYFSPGTTEIVAGGTVLFANAAGSFEEGSTDSVSVVFENPAAAKVADPVSTLSGLVTIPSAGEGNIAPWGRYICDPQEDPFTCLINTLPSVYRSRKFLTPGTYHMRSGPNGDVGTIIVRARPE